MDPRIYQVFLIALIAALITQTIRHLLAAKAGDKLANELAEERKRFTAYRQKAESLRKYEAIVDAEGEAARIVSAAASQEADQELAKIRTPITTCTISKRLWDATELQSDLDEDPLLVHPVADVP